ncbi:MAG: EAL domain-containing protein [Gammaproteobacteria bacterium]
MPRRLDILLVEDNPDDAELAVLELESAGFDFTWQRVETEPDYLAALDRPPDLIIADHTLPTFNAPRALDLLHESKLDIPFIVVSGTIGEEVAVDMMRAGAHDYLLKGHLARLPAAAQRELREARVRKQEAAARRALRDSEQRYRSLVYATAQMVWICDPCGRFAEPQPGWQRYTGQTDEEVIGHGWRDALHPDDRAKVDACWQQAQDSGLFSAECRVRRHDGRYVDFTARAAPVTNAAGDVREWVGVCVDISERKAAESALRAGEERFRRVVETIPDMLYVAEGPELRASFVSPAIETLTGYTQAEWLGDPSLRPMLLGEVSERERRAHVARAPADQHVAQLVYPLHHRDGSERWVQDRMTLVRGDDGQPVQVFGVVTDITERRAAEREMHKLSQAVQQAADAIMITDPDGVIEYVNPAFETISGYGSAEVVGRPASVLKSGKHDDALYRRLWTTVRSGRTFREVLINRTKGGSLFTNEQVITPITDDRGRITHYISTARDITEQVYTQERLGYLVYHDPLTGLGNRTALAEQMTGVLHRAHRSGGRVALVLLGLDRFKLVNETLGYDAGDETLKIVAQRLGDELRETDIVARLEGDEFALALPDMHCVDDIVLAVGKIRACVSEPLEAGGREFFVTASIGVCSYPDDGNDAETLLRNADIALNRAKRQGKNSYEFYSPEMSAHAVNWFTTEVDLRHAIEREEFRVYFQPQVDLASGNIIGLEALMRWQHPERGLLAPGEFMPLLEETGLIVEASDWVLRTACAQNAAWRQAGLQPVTVAVNISWRQFAAADLADRVLAAVERSGMAPAHLELELTESLLAHDPDRALRCLRQLKDQGVSIALDDFGTGYSSLNYLKRFPIDVVKIDKSFVADITSDPEDAAIARAITAMGHSLHMKVVAEGVETEGQLRLLQRHGCDAMQGYYFSPPMPAETITTMLEKHQRIETRLDWHNDKPVLLVVDDEQNIRRALSRCLRADGYRIVTAGSAAEGFELLATNDVAVVLSDQRMPGMTGTEFLARVRQIYPGIVRMVLSGYTDITTVTEAVNRGHIYKFLTKPWDDDELRSEVAAAFDRHKAGPRGHSGGQSAD